MNWISLYPISSRKGRGRRGGSSFSGNPTLYLPVWLSTLERVSPVFFGFSHADRVSGIEEQIVRRAMPGCHPELTDGDALLGVEVHRFVLLDCESGCFQAHIDLDARPSLGSEVGVVVGGGVGHRRGISFPA